MKDIFHSVFFVDRADIRGNSPKNTALHLFFYFIDHIKNDKIMDILQSHTWSNKILKTILTICNDQINIEKTFILSKILICLQ